MLFFRSRLFLRWVGVYMLLLALPTMVTGFVSYRLTRSILVGQAQAASRESVRNAARQFDLTFRDVDTLTVLLEYLPWLTRIVDMSESDAQRADRYSPTDILRIITFLRTCRIRYPVIAEIAIFVKNSDMVIDCEGRYDTDEYFGTRYSLYAPGPGVINRVEWGETELLFFPSVLAQKYEGAPVERILVGRKLPRGSAFPRAAVYFLLDKAYLAHSLEQYTGRSTSGIFAVTSAGERVEGAGNIPEGLLGPIVARGLAGEGQLSFARRSYSYCWAGAGTSDLRYVAITAVADLLREAERLRAATLALTAGVLVLGLILAYLTARRNYLPIRALAERLPAAADAPLQDELQIIARSLADLHTEQEDLRHRLTEFMPVVRANILGRLLSGRGEGIGAGELERCGVRFPGARAVVAGAIVLPGGDGGAAGEMGHPGASALVGARLERFLAEAGESCYVLEQEPFEYRVILSTNADSAQVLKPRFERLVAALRDPAVGGLPVTALVAVSDLHESPAGIGLASAEAQRALDCHFALPEAEVILYAELPETVRDEFAFDTASRRQLLRLLQAGDHQRLAAFLDDLLRSSIMQSRMGARGPYALLEMLQHTLREAEGIDPRQAQSINWSELAALPGDEERIAFCRSTFARVADSVSGRRGAHADAVSRIVAFVDGSFRESAMCLTLLSDRFGLSAIYISRLFKQTTGCNFLDYLNRKRVECAKELLADPRTLIKRAGGEAGFASEVSFRRVFHRYVGMSPGQYRRRILAGEGARHDPS